MQNNLAAAELIKKFYQLFTDLDHNKIIERLARLVIADPAISRVVLIIPQDNQIRIEAIAQSQTNIVLPKIDFENVRDIPHKAIINSIQSGQPVCLEVIYAQTSHANAYMAGTQSTYLYPILDKNRVMAVYYIESLQSLDALEASVQSLEPVWMFSSFLMRNVLELRQYQRQTDEYRKAEQALWASDIYLNSILNNSPALISIKDLNGNVMLASEHYSKLAEVHENGSSEDIYDTYPIEVAQTLWDSDYADSKSAQIIESELEVRHKDGALHTYLMLKFPLRDLDDEVFSVCSICMDITERKLAEEAMREQQSRLNFMAFHDALTGLPNRSLFYDRLNQGLARAHRNQSKLGLMMIDVDRLKTVNDSLGRDAGDEMLKLLAKKMVTELRKMDTVARLESDEFIVILENISNVSDARLVASKVLARLSEPLTLNETQVVKNSVSIGISVYPQDGSAADELLKRADIAMHKAKENGKNNYLYFAEGMDSTSVKFMVLEKDLRIAIDQNQLRLYYQPQVDLKTGSLVGVEALVRWQHPERGLIAPAHFIPLAEETGLIVPLGEWLVRQASIQQKKWIAAGISVGKIALNLSPRQLRQRDFATRLQGILDEVELPAKYLELEITETSAMEHAGETVNMLTQLNQMGLSLAIDDFGTGYSSLAYLKRFPIQKLKIDRSFIHDIYTDQNDASIAMSIIGLAHNMSLSVVAEGVENEEQASWLRKRGCDQAQGYLYAQPIPAEKLESYFSSGVAMFNKEEIELELPF